MFNADNLKGQVTITQSETQKEVSLNPVPDKGVVITGAGKASHITLKGEKK